MFKQTERTEYQPDKYKVVVYICEHIQMLYMSMYTVVLFASQGGVPRLNMPIDLSRAVCGLIFKPHKGDSHW